MARILGTSALVCEADEKPKEACICAQRALVAAWDPSVKQSIQEVIERVCLPPPA
jgi:hypothetical protein